MRSLAAFALSELKHHNSRIASFVRSNCEHLLQILTPGQLAAIALLTSTSWLVHFLAVRMFFYVQPPRFRRPYCFFRVPQVFGS